MNSTATELHASSNGYAVAALREPGAEDSNRFEAAIESAREWLLDRQHPDGHWVGELEGDTILETEYVLLLHFLGDPDASQVRKLCNYILRKWQNADGGFPIYPGGPSEISASVKAYFACKLAGHAASEPHMDRLRERILALGGVARCNTFTKLYLAIFGQFPWEAVPTIPPELFFVPNWFYLNIYEMSSWSRAILVPLAVMNAVKPFRPVPEGRGIEELFAGSRSPKDLRHPFDRKPVTWRNVFLAADTLLRVYDRAPMKPLRKRALRAAEAWLLARQERSGGLGAIFPAMTHAVMAYICLGYSPSDAPVRHETDALETFLIEEGDEIRVQPCFSPVWDTALSICALVDSGLPPEDPAIRRAADWLLSKQTTKVGDWAVKAKSGKPGGWFFEYENEFYPDVDDTVMVLMALYRAGCPEGGSWESAPERLRTAMRRGLDWVFAMQNRDGGFASFDKDNNRVIFQYVPFADHNAMLDAATSDITARTLEMMSTLRVEGRSTEKNRALSFLLRHQERDGSWFGRWGVNYVYGTWQAIRGLAVSSAERGEAAVLRAAEWLKSVQNADGGWGETCASYEDPAHQKAKGPSTASQTAWAIMGLVNAGEHRSASVRRGLEFLIDSQRPDGTWDEESFTGTGFPKVFYLRYHLYRHYFPLWAMGQYRSAGGPLGAAPRREYAEATEPLPS